MAAPSAVSEAATGAGRQAAVLLARDAEALEEAYDAWAEQYDEDLRQLGGGTNVAGSSTAAVLMKHATCESHPRLVDFGCGTGEVRAACGALPCGALPPNPRARTRARPRPPARPRTGPAHADSPQAGVLLGNEGWTDIVGVDLSQVTMHASARARVCVYVCACVRVCACVHAAACTWLRSTPTNCCITHAHTHAHAHACSRSSESPAEGGAAL